MKGHLSLSTLESPSSKTVVPDSLLDMICLPSDNNKHDDSDIMTPGVFFLSFAVAVLCLISKTRLNPANGEREGALGAFCLCKRVNGWRPLDLMEMNREL